MKLVDEEFLNKINKADNVWYACYGSNINSDRFMLYINGDESLQHGSREGCQDKTPPQEERPFIFDAPVYFAGNSTHWHGGGYAFLDYENPSKDCKSYGKIYKIKFGQFLNILKQEQRSPLYNAVILVEYIDELPVLTFTAKHKLTNMLNPPSEEYARVIREGIKETFGEMDHETE